MKLILVLSFFIFISNSFASEREGGGGDATEIAVNEIRNDILEWIEQRHYKKLTFNNRITSQIYKDEMLQILQPNYVSCYLT